MKRAVLYLRVSTQDQTTANQERELREIAGRAGCEVVKVYKDHGISGAKGRDKRPGFNALCRDATKFRSKRGAENYRHSITSRSVSARISTSR
jgi:DNA invertase Pin-like site-specific DNA recombinase